MIETISFQEHIYPKFQSEGNAAKFILPFAMQVCKGVGLDIGGNRKEWTMPGAKLIDLGNGLDDFHAHNLPTDNVDYIFSSHCLEHVERWVEALDIWTDKIKSGGTLFLYLPHPDQFYWLPFNNRKHINYLTPYLIESYLKATRKYKNIFVSQRDLNHSFAAMAEKI